VIHIDLLNRSTQVSDLTVKYLRDALQTQVNRDFEPIWGFGAALTFVPKGGYLDPTHWQLIFFDNADVAGALGYHELTAAGLPLGKVFVQTAKQAGLSWTVTASHELLEMLSDPYANTAVIILDNSDIAGTAYAYEVCDACEDDSFGYTIYGFQVSDFVKPEWFEPPPGNTPATKTFDFKGHITAPFQLLMGGYIGVFQIPDTVGWAQLNAVLSNVNAQKVDLKPRSSRLKLRQTPQQQRKNSLV
jgi:hypothetical protein